MQKKLFISALLLVFISILSSCKDHYRGLTDTQKKLMDSLISRLKSEKAAQGPALVDVKTQTTESKITEKFLQDYLFGIKSLDPVSASEAWTLYSNHTAKTNAIQGAFGGTLRGGYETRSLLVSADSLKIFVDSLIYYQNLLSTKTGARIVLGTYPYDGTVSDPLKSGRTTVFFVGTIDTAGNNTKFLWQSHRDMPLLGGFLSLRIRNHGELCPDECGTRNTIYR